MVLWTKFYIIYVTTYTVIIRVRTGPGNPGKSLNFKKSLSRPGKSWNSDAGPGKSWKSELGYLVLLRQMP